MGTSGIAIGDQFFCLSHGYVWRVCWLLYGDSEDPSQVVLREQPDNRLCCLVTPSTLGDRDFYQPLTTDEADYLLKRK